MSPTVLTTIFSSLCVTTSVFPTQILLRCKFICCVGKLPQKFSITFKISDRQSTDKNLESDFVVFTKNKNIKKQLKRVCALFKEIVEKPNVASVLCEFCFE